MFEYKYYPKIKSYHIILLLIVICPFFTIKSNSVYKIGDEEDQLNDDYKFLEKLYLRKLDFKSDVDEICSKSSENLKLYYITGNTKSIGINNDNKIESEDNNPQYINALINIISGKNDSVEDDINEYVKHLIPVIVLFSIAILSILIWIIFIICRCLNCCCCCCCKKKMCKLPFFFIIMILYTLVLSLSFFELSQSNSIFVGLADTECSILKFIDEVLEGETKKAKPKWSGINEITGLFQDTITQIQNLTPDNKNILSTEKDNASSAKDSFETALQYYSTNFLPSNNPDYKQVLNGQNYYLDIIYNFGNFTKRNSETISSAEPPNSFVSKWYQEFKLISENSEKQMGIALENYGQLEESKDSAESTLNQGISSISDIEESFNDIKEQISGIIISYSGKIDQNGKIAFKVILSVYMILDLTIIIYIILLMFFPFKCCRKCCCLKCLLKLLLHIFWNILAVLTIFILFFGCIFILFGTAGKDLISVVSFLVSDKNLNQEEPIFFGQVKNYLSKCINGNGDISSDIFGDLDSMDNIDKLRNAANEINNITEDMEYLKANPRAYKDYKEDYENRINYTIDNFELINLGEGSNLNFRTYLNNLNSDIASSKNHEWNISCSSSHSCDSPENYNTEHLCINPNTCENKDITDWYSDTGNNNINVINAFIKSIKMSKSSAISTTTVDTTEMKETNNIEVILEDLKIKYNSFIQTQIDSLTKFSDNINQLAEIFNRFDGERNRNNIYSIINCKFIGKNVKVILKNFEELLGNIIYTVGICLEISGISMLISIALTILLNSIIINSSIGK